MAASGHPSIGWIEDRSKNTFWIFKGLFLSENNVWKCAPYFRFTLKPWKKTSFLEKWILQSYSAFHKDNFRSTNLSKEKFNRSSHQRCSVQNDVLRNFTKFAGKHLCQSLFLKDSLLWILWNFKKTPFLENTSRRLLLNTNQMQIEKMKKKPYSKEKGNIRVTLDTLSKISRSTSEILIKIYEHLCSSVKKSWTQSLNNPTIN